MSSAEWQVIWLTVRVAALSTLCTLPLALMVASLLVKSRSWIAQGLHGLVMLPLVLPPVVTGYLLLASLGRSSWLGRQLEALLGEPIAYSSTACIIAAGVVGFPLMVESIRIALLGVDARYLMVSRSLGRSRLASFVRITLPLALPGILAGCVFGFARAMGEYGATVVLAGNISGETETISLRVMVAMQSLSEAEHAVALRLVIASVVLSLIALFGAISLQRRQRARLLDWERAGRRDV